MVKNTTPQPYAIFFIGHQYTGKTTLRNMIIESHPQYDFKLYSLDSYIHKLCDENGVSYSDGFKQFANEAGKLLEVDFKQWIKEKQSILIDRTNTTVRSRQKLLNRLDGYEVDYIFFNNLTDEEIQRRQEMRPDQVVPLHIVQEFRDRIEKTGEVEARRLGKVFHMPTNWYKG